MSHIVTATTTIKNPSVPLLRQVAQLIATKHQGQVREVYHDYYHVKHRTSLRLAVQTPQLERGIGLEVEQSTGGLIFKGDPWGADELFEQLQQEIVQTYVSAATMQALAAMGYTPQAEDIEHGQVAIRGVAYA